MAQGVDAQELLNRIRRARDWAAREEERILSEQTPDDDDHLAASIQATAYNAVRVVLDEILQPGQHSGS